MTYTGAGYNYYWTSVDESGHGVKELVGEKEINEDLIVAGISVDDINISKQVEDNSKYLVINEYCVPEDLRDVEAEVCVEDNPRMTIAKDNWPTVIP